MDVYFDFTESGSNITLGVVMVEDFDTILQEMKTVQKGADTNFYHWTLEAFEYALELLLEDDFDEVCFKNQQKLIFEWLVNGNYKEHYEGYYEGVKENLVNLVNSGGEFTYEVVKGDANRAKKYLRKSVKKTVVSSAATGDLTSLFKSNSVNVVEFLNRNRKQA